MQNPDAEHRTCTALQHTCALQYTYIYSAQYKNKYINSHSAKQNLNHKKNCYNYHSSYKRSVTPFCFQLLTIISSFIGTHYEHRQANSVFICKFTTCTITFFNNNIDTILETVLLNFIQRTSCPLKNFGPNEIQIVPHWIIHSTKQNRPISK